MPTGRLSIERSTAATVTIGGRELVLFAGCDYLALAHHSRVLAALERGVAEFGLSSAGSRETTGNTVAHDDLERDLARFFGVEAALLVPDGYLSNLIFAQGLPPEIDTVVVDRESHVSVRDAIAATGRRERIYPFLDTNAARGAVESLGGAPCALFTDGVFPVMRGVAPLKELLQLLPTEGVLVVDDCHGVGVLGARGRGAIEHCELRDPRIVITGTLSKALGCFGGFVAGSREHIERTRARSRAYVGSTPIPPALARAASEALRIVDDEPERRRRLLDHVLAVRAVFRAAERPFNAVPFPVFSFQLASHEEMERTYQSMLAEGLLVPYVHYPDSLGGYFRVVVRADHRTDHIERLVSALQRAFFA
jgi:8-amino-7-oxononanoate synthase